VKKIFCILAFSLASLSVTATPSSMVFINADNSKEAELCIASAYGKSALKRKASELDIYGFQISQIRCNDMTVKEFSVKHKYKESDKGVVEKAVEVYSFNNIDNSLSADICIAAARSKVEYRQIVSGSGLSRSAINKIRCNDLTIAQFSKKYERKDFKI